MRLTRILALVACLSMLSACGGGGGGSGGGGGGGGSTGGPGGFSISGTTASFNEIVGVPPSTRDFQVTITGSKATFFGAAYTTGQTPVSWLNLSITGSGTSYVLHVSVNSFMSPGHYTTQFS